MTDVQLYDPDALEESPLADILQESEWQERLLTSNRRKVRADLKKLAELQNSPTRESPAA